MQTHIDATLEADPALASAVREAVPILESVLGESAEDARAEWSLERDARDRPLIVLRFSDFNGEFVGRFTPDELAAPRHLKERLYDLMGDLLQDRTRKLLERVRSRLDEIERARVAQD